MWGADGGSQLNRSLQVLCAKLGRYSMGLDLRIFALIGIQSREQQANGSESQVRNAETRSKATTRQLLHLVHLSVALSARDDLLHIGHGDEDVRGFISTAVASREMKGVVFSVAVGVAESFGIPLTPLDSTTVVERENSIVWPPMSAAIFRRYFARCVSLGSPSTWLFLLDIGSARSTTLVVMRGSESIGSVCSGSVDPDSVMRRPHHTPVQISFPQPAFAPLPSSLPTRNLTPTPHSHSQTCTMSSSDVLASRPAETNANMKRPDYTHGPRMDIFDTQDDVKVYVDLPGMKKDEVAVKLQDGLLHISGIRKAHHMDKVERRHVLERAQGPFEVRKLALVS
ncbi:hypothetical protein BDK51DRAFT_37381 [Blyttiomyces helicus]|uniref:SHSP domain-containing protein n=1 Tax=Blyttiomyces helicus TaxID=388810 RepID=A0A4P9WNC9_9FUNG|nr:hypothetical protein BDK51DRAFT_37381 [Blyttiomyces helicus]|eukprot:RKO93775.1 hypothetical protein BDK51DRAFT_37381 [Blyttiomyces helicus]